MRLFYQPEGRLRLETEDRCHLSVRPVWAAPLSRPNNFLALLDEKDREVLLIADPSTLAPEQRDVLMQELHARYLTCRVTGVHSAKTEFGATYWSVETDRGHKEFVTQSLQENAYWLGDGHLLLSDVDGNKFEIVVADLNPASQAQVAATV